VYLSTAEAKNAWSYTFTPTVRLYGVVLNQWLRIQGVALS